MNCRPCRDDERDAILEIVNAAAQAYRGVIPDDRWHDPYMPRSELDEEIAAGVEFWGCEEDGELLGVMGVQALDGVDLIRHAYVRPDQIGQFNRHGYLKPFRIFSPNEADDLRAYFDKLLASVLASGGSSYSISTAHLRHGQVYDLLTHPRIVAYVTDLLGDDVVGWGSHFFCKMPKDGKGVSWPTCRPAPSARAAS